MRVFISWSKDRSKKVAELLHDWMPRVIQVVDPYISSRNIEKGARWASDLAAQLEGTNFGVVCLLPENKDETWIQFEAGALSKSLTHGMVAPILFGLEEAELSQNPLVQFNLTPFQKSEMLLLMKTMNGQRAPRPLGLTFWSWRSKDFGQTSKAPSGTFWPKRGQSARKDRCLGTTSRWTR